MTENSVSLHFTNFPISWSKSDMVHVFSAYGTVRDLHLPRDPDLLGRRYGFVRFSKNQDIPQIIQGLNEIWVGTSQLQVSLARAAGALPDTPSAPGMLPFSPNPDQQGMTADSQDAADTIHFCPDPDATPWLHSCLIGVPSPILDRDTLNKILHRSGYGGGSAIRLEGGEVLLKLSSIEEQRQLLNDSKTVEQLCLHSLRPWKLLNGKPTRVVWVRIKGIPLHFWYEKLFGAIAEKLGELILVDTKTLDMSEMQFCRIKILTSTNTPIHRRIHIVTEEGSFFVKVLEEAELHYEPSVWARKGRHLLRDEEWPPLDPKPLEVSGVDLCDIAEQEMYGSAHNLDERTVVRCGNRIATAVSSDACTANPDVVLQQQQTEANSPVMLGVDTANPMTENLHLKQVGEVGKYTEGAHNEGHEPLSTLSAATAVHHSRGHTASATVFSPSFELESGNSYETGDLAAAAAPKTIMITWKPLTTTAQSPQTPPTVALAHPSRSCLFDLQFPAAPDCSPPASATTSSWNKAIVSSPTASGTPNSMIGAAGEENAAAAKVSNPLLPTCEIVTSKTTTATDRPRRKKKSTEIFRYVNVPIGRRRKKLGII